MLQTSLLLSLDSQYSSLSSCWVGMLFSDLESVMILQTFVTFIFYQHTKSICLFHFVTFYFALLFRLFLIWLAKHVALWLCSWSWLWSWLQVPSCMGNFYYILLYFIFNFIFYQGVNRVITNIHETSAFEEWCYACSEYQCFWAFFSVSIAFFNFHSFDFSDKIYIILNQLFVSNDNAS